MGDADDGETIQVFARVKGPVVLNARKAPAPTRGRVLAESDDEDEIERRAREMAVEYSVIKEQAPMLQDEYQRISREKREASKKDAAKQTPPPPKRPVEAKGSEGTKKRKLGKKERAKLKAAAQTKATSPSNDAVRCEMF
jgi:hypothetical protein